MTHRTHSDIFNNFKELHCSLPYSMLVPLGNIQQGPEVCRIFLKLWGAQKSIPRIQFRQPICGLSPNVLTFKEPRNLFRQPMYSLAGRYDNPLCTRYHVPIDCLKFPAQSLASIANGDKNSETSWKNIMDVFLDFSPCIYFLDGKVLVDLGKCLGDISMLIKRLALKVWRHELWGLGFGGGGGVNLKLYMYSAKKKRKEIQKCSPVSRLLKNNCASTQLVLELHDLRSCLWFCCSNIEQVGLIWPLFSTCVFL